MKIFKGHLSISRFSSTEVPFRGVDISLDDEHYRRIVTIILTIPQWGDVSSGLSSVDCQVKLYTVDLESK